MDDFGLGKLVEKSKQLTSHSEDQTFHLRRNIDQIEQQARQLAQRPSRTVDQNSVNRAYVLLAQKGVDAQRIERNLATLDLKVTPQQTEALAETNVDAFLSHHHEKIVSSAIHEAQRETIRTFDRAYEERMALDWNESKKELLEMLNSSRGLWGGDSLADSGSSSPREPPFKRGGLSTSVSSGLTGGSSVDFGGSSSAFSAQQNTTSNEKKVVEFAKAVHKVYEARVETRKIGVVSLFANASAAVEERNALRRKELVDSWELLRKIVGEEGVNPSTGYYKDQNKGISEKEFESMLKGSHSTALRKKFLVGSRHFLEGQFMAIVEDEVRSRPTVANIGSDYSNAAKIRGYVNVLQANGPSEVQPARHFMEIYFAMRIGDGALATDLAARSKVPNLGAYVQKWASRDQNGMDETSLSAIRAEYRKLEHSGGDAYQILVYNILGQCDARKAFNQRLPYARWTTQDYLWMTLHMINEVSIPVRNSSSGATAITLADFQRQMSEQYGAAFWAKSGKSPLIYFQILLLSQQFEKAIDFLVSAGSTSSVFSTSAALLSAEFAVEAFHFGLAMSYYGIINEPTKLSEIQSFQHQFLFESGGYPHLNISRLSRMFVSLLTSRDINAALDYAYFISKTEIRHEAIKELVMESRAFNILLGSVDAEAKVERGLIFAYMPEDVARALIHDAAVESEHRGMFQEAATLFQLAQDDSQVLTLMSKQLSRVVALPKDNSDRIQLRQLATMVFAFYNKDNRFSRIEVTVVKTFKLLCQLIYFYDLTFEGLFQDAIEHLKTLQLVPMSDAEVNSRLEQFKTLSELIRRNFPRLLADAMFCIYQTNSMVRNSKFGRDADQASRVLKEEARVLVKFVGLLNYQIPGDINARILSLEASII